MNKGEQVAEQGRKVREKLSVRQDVDPMTTALLAQRTRNNFLIQGLEASNDRLTNRMCEIQGACPHCLNGHYPHC